MPKIAYQLETFSGISVPDPHGPRPLRTPSLWLHMFLLWHIPLLQTDRRCPE